MFSSILLFEQDLVRFV